MTREQILRIAWELRDFSRWMDGRLPRTDDEREACELIEAVIVLAEREAETVL